MRANKFKEKEKELDEGRRQLGKELSEERGSILQPKIAEATGSRGTQNSGQEEDTRVDMDTNPTGVDSIQVPFNSDVIDRLVVEDVGNNQGRCIMEGTKGKVQEGQSKGRTRHDRLEQMVSLGNLQTGNSGQVEGLGADGGLEIRLKGGKSKVITGEEAQDRKKVDSETGKLKIILTGPLETGIIGQEKEANYQKWTRKVWARGDKGKAGAGDRNRKREREIEGKDQRQYKWAKIETGKRWRRNEEGKIRAGTKEDVIRGKDGGIDRKGEAGDRKEIDASTVAVVQHRRTL